MRPIVIGVPFDNGIRSMLHLKRGVAGADEGCQTVLECLNGAFDKIFLPVQKFNLKIDKKGFSDPQFIKDQKAATIRAHDFIGKLITLQLINQRRFIAIGGDHSITAPILKGIISACKSMDLGELGVINLDAHYDMRKPEGKLGVISSGNSFYQIIEDEQIPVEGKNIMAIGIQKSTRNSFLAMDEYAKQRGVKTIYAHRLHLFKDRLERFLRRHKAVYLSIDMDVFDESVAPSVSAPNKNGISKELGLQIIRSIVRTKKLLAADIVEVSDRNLSWKELYEKESAESPETRKRNLDKTIALVKEIVNELLKA